MSKVKTLADRVVERGRGCWNCTGFNNEELAKQKYAVHRAAKAAQLMIEEAATGARAGVQVQVELDRSKIQHRIDAMMAEGFGETEAIALIAKAEDAKANSGPTGGMGDPRFRLFDTLMMTGEAGICMAGKAETDFVHAGFLCGSWNGRQGSSMATDGHPIDPLPEELRAIVDEKAKKVSG